MNNLSSRCPFQRCGGMVTVGLRCDDIDFIALSACGQLLLQLRNNTTLSALKYADAGEDWYLWG